MSDATGTLMTSESAPHRVNRLDLNLIDWQWPFADARRGEIDAHFAEARRVRPAMFNGRILLARDARCVGDVFRADYFETDFASFLAWRDWGFPDRDVFNGFGAGALRANDGAYALGEMAAHTANAGKIYFPAGTPDLNDVRGSRFDIPGSIFREMEEETGLGSADYRVVDGWDIVFDGQMSAIIQTIDVDMPGDVLRATLEANLAVQEEQELSGIHLVRSVADFTPAMPRYVVTFLTARL
jgi:8-oxo-dGTP pyrophosphatase MutT (NUDIX family)